jgi:hypothetical protein
MKRCRTFRIRNVYVCRPRYMYARKCMYTRLCVCMFAHVSVLEQPRYERYLSLRSYWSVKNKSFPSRTLPRQTHIMTLGGRHLIRRKGRPLGGRNGILSHQRNFQHKKREFLGWNVCIKTFYTDTHAGHEVYNEVQFWITPNILNCHTQNIHSMFYSGITSLRSHQYGLKM